MTSGWMMMMMMMMMTSLTREDEMMWAIMESVLLLLAYPLVDMKAVLGWAAPYFCFRKLTDEYKNTKHEKEEKEKEKEEGNRLINSAPFVWKSKPSVFFGLSSISNRLPFFPIYQRSRPILHASSPLYIFHHDRTIIIMASSQDGWEEEKKAQQLSISISNE